MSDNTAPAAIEGIMRRAAAFEAKYQVFDLNALPLSKSIQILSAGVHRGNRGFVYTQGKRCREIIISTHTDGFDKAEANIRGVAVQERPACEQPIGYETCFADNLNKSRDDQSDLDWLCGVSIHTVGLPTWLQIGKLRFEP